MQDYSIYESMNKQHTWRLERQVELVEKHESFGVLGKMEVFFVLFEIRGISELVLSCARMISQASSESGGELPTISQEPSKNDPLIL